MGRSSIVFQKSDIEKWFVVLCVGIISLLIIYITSSIVIHVCAITLVCITSIIISKFDIMHPYFGFSLVYTLYSIGYPMLCVIGTSSYDYAKSQLLYSTIGLLIALLTIGPKKIEKIDISKESDKTIDYKYMDYFIIVLVAFSVLASLMLLRRGYSGKTQMQRANDLYYRFGVYSVRFLTLFSIMRITNLYLQNKKYKWIVLSGGIATLMFGLLTGERDSFIRFFVCVFYILFVSNVINKKHFLILSPLAVVFMGMSNTFKYFFLTGNLRGTFDFSNVFENFFGSDFSAAGRNLQYLLDHEWTNGYFGFKLIITELLYPLLPSSVRVNPDRWFNYNVHDGGFHGYAFTLVGTGYIVSGVIGVVVVFIIVGLIIRALYNRSNKDVYYLTIYIYTTTILMYAMRQSLNTFSNSFMKEIIVVMGVCAVFNRIMKNTSTSYKS